MTVGNVVKIVNSVWVDCENICSGSSLLAAGDVSRGGTDVFAGYVWVKSLTNTACGS